MPKVLKYIVDENISSIRIMNKIICTQLAPILTYIYATVPYEVRILHMYLAHYKISYYTFILVIRVCMLTSRMV